MKLTPRQVGQGNAFFVIFRHPTFRLVRRSLCTSDETTAKAICLDAMRLFDALAKNQAVSLAAYERRAVEIVLGDKEAKERLEAAVSRAIAEDEAQDAASVIAGKIGPKSYLIRGGGVSPADIIAEEIGEMNPRNWQLAQEKIGELEKMVKVLTAERDELQELVARYRHKYNLHIKLPLAEAVELFLADYKTGHTEQTRKLVKAAVDGFTMSLPKGFRLGEVRAQHIEEWLKSLKNIKTGEELNPVTRHRQKAYISVFFSWATRKYELGQNPIDYTGTVAGVARNGKGIVAIKRYSDLKGYIAALTPWPYWQAVVAIGMLAGPRYDELVHLQIKDVYLDDDGDEILISNAFHKTKTGKERRIPVEHSILKPILKAWIRRRKTEQKMQNMTDAMRSRWLFPSLPGEGTLKRQKSLPGTWSSNRVFLDWMRPVQAEAAIKAGVITVKKEEDGDVREAKLLALRGTDNEHWAFIPSEWRHTFGTVLGRCGFSSFEIASFMGNSEAVARAHYVKVLPGASRWPLKW